ncbi:MAG TPA: hypothetical protein VJ807_03225 [Gaiellaceae bacterium]|nr:hypothetical protein [Gaiellaceae bacterium]
MHLEATPPLSEGEHRALVAALEHAVSSWQALDPYGKSWRQAALREAALGDETEIGYAFSPRSTRGATRA